MVGVSEVRDPYRYDQCACGAWKRVCSARCLRCRRQAEAEAAAARRRCPVCGGPKHYQSTMCKGCMVPSGNRGEVDPRPIAAAVKSAVAEGMNLSQIAYAAGWCYEGHGGDTTALQRRLGLKPLSGARNGGRTTRAMRYETAVRIVRAIGLAPVDLGL